MITTINDNNNNKYNENGVADNAVSNNQSKESHQNSDNITSSSSSSSSDVAVEGPEGIKTATTATTTSGSVTHEDNDDDKNDDEDDTTTSTTIQSFLIRKGSDLGTIIKESKVQPSSAILVILAYRENCEQSMDLLWKFRTFIQELENITTMKTTTTTMTTTEGGADKDNNRIGDQQQQQQPQQQQETVVTEANVTSFLQTVAPIFVQMPVTPDTVNVLDQFGYNHVPVLFFLKEQGQVSNTGQDANNDDDGNNDNNNNNHNDPNGVTPLVYAIQYRGRDGTMSDLYDGIIHYGVRIRHSQMVHHTNTKTGMEYLSSMTVQTSSPQDLRDTVLDVYTVDYVFYRPVTPYDPDLSHEEMTWIRYMMDEHSDDNDDDRYGDDDDDDRHHPQPDHTMDDHYLFDDAIDVEEGPYNNYYTICQCRKQHQNDDTSEQASASSSSTTTTPTTTRLLYYDEFDQVAAVLSERRDVLFCVYLHDCSLPQNDVETKNNGTSTNDDDRMEFHDGDIMVFTVYPDSSNDGKTTTRMQFETYFRPIDQKEEHREEGDPPQQDTGVSDFITTLLRPTLLWLDRKMTAPIAFHPRHRLHAVLFVDFHNRGRQRIMRDAVRMFRTACNDRRGRHNHRRHHDGPIRGNIHHQVDDSSSLVCLVVPSTDTRILTTFGIDIWTPLDEEASKLISSALCHNDSGPVRTKGSNSGVKDANDRIFHEGMRNRENDCHRVEDVNDPLPVLPTILVTDRRGDTLPGIRRFYLDPPFTGGSIESFLDDVIAGRAQPDVKSGTVPSHNGNVIGKNIHSVHILTASSLPAFLQDNQQKHVLVQLYAPTCGHCKRFNILWNSLGDLVKYIGWDDRLVLGRLDVTTNEITIPGMTTEWLPDLFYFGVNVVESPIHYGRTNMAVDVELGGIIDPLDLLDWWIDEAGDTIDVTSLLHDLEGMDSTTKKA